MRHRFLSLFLTVAVAVAAPLFEGRLPARAACGSIPNVFTNGVNIVDATTTNANNNFLLACATNVDSSQIGAAGIFASQIIPTSPTNATFGGPWGYKFNSPTTSQVALTVNAPSGQSVDIFDVSLNGVVKTYVDSTGVLHAAGFATGLTPSRALVTDGSGNLAVAADLPVLVSGAQTIAGAKTFSSALTAANVHASQASIGGTVGTESYFGTDGSGFMNLLASGNAFVFRTGSGTTEATINASGIASNNGVNVGGALSNATTGGFSSTVTAAQFMAGVGGTAGTALTYGNSTAGGALTVIKSDGAATVQGIGQTVLGIAVPSVINSLALDVSGNLGIAGQLKSTGINAGTGTSQGSSNGSTVAYHPPVYTGAGAATAATVHIVGPITSTCTSGTGCTTITLTGAAVFSSTTSAACWFSPQNTTGGATGGTFSSGSSLVPSYSAAQAPSATVVGYCIGT